MSDFDPTFATAGEIAAAVRTRRISSRDLVRETFDRIDRHNPTLNAIIWPDPETAMARAEAADEVAPVGRTAAGLPAGVQIVAPMWEDGTSIEFAAMLSDVVGGFTPPPAFRS